MQQVLDYFGGVAATARALKVKSSAVSNWKHRGIPDRRAIQIERQTGGKIKAIDLVANN